MSNNKCIKFDLPIGAVIGGMRHLGGGQFIAALNPEVGSPMGLLNLIIEGVIEPEDEVSWPHHLPFELVDEHLSGSAVRTVSIIGLASDEMEKHYANKQERISHSGHALKNVLRHYVCEVSGRIPSKENIEQAVDIITENIKL